MSQSDSIVIDNHSGDHGDWVEYRFEEHYTNQVLEFDLGSSSVSITEINQQFQRAIDFIEAGNEVDVINLSFGGGNYTTPWSLLTGPDDPQSDFNNLNKELWNHDVIITTSAGNNGDKFAGDGVSLLSSTPFNLSIGAVDSSGKDADYSQWDAFVTEFFAYGSLPEYNVRGTSFSAPDLGGTAAEIKQNLDLTNPQVLTLLDQTSDHFVAYDEGQGPYDNGEPKSLQMMRLNPEKALNATGPEAIEEREIIDAWYRLGSVRNPDEAGSDFWTQYAKDNGLDSAINNLVFGAENAGDWQLQQSSLVFSVKSLYEGILHREADTGGMGYWLDYAVNQEYGFDWSTVVEAFVNAAETTETIYHQSAINLITSENNSQSTLERGIDVDSDEFTIQPVGRLEDQFTTPHLDGA